MKIIASLFVLVALGSQAQTLSKGDITPMIGDSFMVQIYNNQPQINLEHAGINQVWDLSQITRSVEVNKYYRVVHPDSTPFDIPFASFAYRYFLDTDTTSIGYTYFKDSMHGFYELADILPYRNIEYSNAEFIFKLPLILNDSITDYSCYSTVLSTFYDELCGESGLKFDGTGTLILPTGTYTDMYRLAYTNYYYRKSMGDTIYTQSWFWYKKGTHFPIAEYKKFTMSGIDYITINLLHASISSGLSGSDYTMKLWVYPNPTNGKLTLKNDEISLNGFTLRIYDMNGQLLKTEHIVTDAHEFNLDLHGLNSGCYYYSMSTESTSGTTGKLLIK